jgi:ppGpp synthetase/RelA/SpoT-type nucleotidyltranferase
MEPAALASAYASLRPSLDKLAEYARDRLRAELVPQKPVLIDPRVKDLPSAYQKLQTGHYKSLRSLEDLVGVKVVVLRRSEIEPVAEVVRTSFQVVREKERVVDPSVFRYRERHLIIKPPTDFLDRNPDLADLLVELQLTSAVQHALDQVTHDFDYKGQTLDWAKFRLVAQLRAALELVDNLLDSMDASAALIEQSVQFPEALLQQNATLGVIAASFQEDALPNDRRRLAETAAGLLAAAGVVPDALPDLLGRHVDLVNAQSINPLDAILGALLREHAPRLIANYEDRFAVSDELLSLCPEVGQIPTERIVDLA